MFDPGLGIEPNFEPLGFTYKDNCFGPVPEERHLYDIRRSLRDQRCTGPEVVYSIAMDVGKKGDRALLEQLGLLFGAVVFASGRLGEELIRSQGHVHAVLPSAGMSTPELYEIWNGRALIYAQEFTDDIPGICYAVEAGQGEVVLVPPGWAHCTISADSGSPLAFGAWCVREYGFVYDEVRAHGGLAYYPIWRGERLIFQKNDSYGESQLIQKAPRRYDEFGLGSEPIYRQFEKDPKRFAFITHPDDFTELWENFVP